MFLERPPHYRVINAKVGNCFQLKVSWRDKGLIKSRLFNYFKQMVFNNPTTVWMQEGHFIEQTGILWLKALIHGEDKTLMKCYHCVHGLGSVYLCDVDVVLTFTFQFSLGMEVATLSSLETRNSFPNPISSQTWHVENVSIWHKLGFNR